MFRIIRVNISPKKLRGGCDPSKAFTPIFYITLRYRSYSVAWWPLPCRMALLLVLAWCGSVWIGVEGAKCLGNGEFPMLGGGLRGMGTLEVAQYEWVTGVISP